MAFKSVQDSLDIKFSAENRETWGAGANFFDVNEDGWDDIFYLGQDDGYYPVFVNISGTFTKHSTNITASEQAKQALWIDYDNDSDYDLIIAYRDSTVRLYRCDSNFFFTDITVSSGINLITDIYYTLSAADIDNNGFLDYYVGNYGLFYSNKLLMCDNTLQLSEHALQFGVGDSLKTTFGTVMTDMNNDGLVDIYTTNDHSNVNECFINNGDSTFTAAGDSLGLDAILNGMGVCAADLNGDFFPEIFLTNTGTNMLYVSDSNGQYTEMAVTAGVVNSYTSWGCSFFDAELDMDWDLVSMEGLTGFTGPALPNFLFVNNGNLQFTADSTTIDDEAVPAYSSAKGDLNNDGLVDFLINNSEPGEIEVWQNQTNTANNWLKLMLTGTISNHDAIGSRILVYINGVARRYDIKCGEGYLSQNSQSISISLGSNSSIDSLNVRWPSGEDTTLFDVEATQHIRLVENGIAQPLPTIILPDGGVICSGDAVRLAVGGNYTNVLWSNGSTTDTILTNIPGIYSVTVTNQFGHVKGSHLVEIIHKSKPAFELQNTHPKCFGVADGKIEAIPSFSQGWVKYEWNNGLKDAVNAPLDTGTYRVTVTNEFGCQRSKKAKLVYPEKIDLDYALDHARCFGNSDGYVSLSMFGGTPPYSYVWSNAQFTDSISSLVAGSYSVTISDINNCDTSLTFHVLEPEALEALEGQTKISVDPEIWELNAVISGGTAPYTYSWSHDQSFDSPTLQVADSGEYILAVLDSNQCALEVAFDVKFDSINSVNDFADSQAPKWWPNPVIDGEIFCNVQVDKIRLTTISGVEIQNDQNCNRIRLEQLPSGVYLIESEIKGTKGVQRLVVTK